MKNQILLLVILCLTLTTPIIAQELVLDPNQFINTQILGDTLADGSRAHSIYKLERSKFYALDGRLDINFRCEIVGPYNGPIIHDNTNGHPPVIVNTPDASTGAARQLFQILDGGELILKNCIVSGRVSTGFNVYEMITSNGGELYHIENVVITDWGVRAFRSFTPGIDVIVKDCVILNGWTVDYNPWNGMPFRFETSGNNVVIENNTFVNTGRIFCNSGPFLKMKMHINHNSFLNTCATGHELRHFEFISANNLWFNWYFCGYSYMEINTQDMYQLYFPTHNEFTPISDKLDSVSCYLGQNAFFREKEIEDWYAAQDSFFLSGFWEYPAVDSFVMRDDNFTIGTNYKDFDPQFATPVGNTDEIVAWIDGYWYEERRPTDVPDWRVELPVEFPDGGAPVCNWPPAFDLSYSNATLKAGGSDGLPIGDLNWFPEAKAIYLANRDQFIAALQDSIVNAKKIYAPPLPSPFITPTTVEELVLDPNQFINTQILGDTLADGSRAHSIYKLERSKFYALDGRLDINFRCEIVGPYNGPIIHDNTNGHPPVIVNTPDASTGAPRQLFQILNGGELILKNCIVSGRVSTGFNAFEMITSNGGELYHIENVVITDWWVRAFVNNSPGIDVIVKDCVILNGWTVDYNPWNGMPFRFNTGGNNVVIENNTFVNTGRIFCNSGPFLKMKMHINHNSFLNTCATGHELRHFEFISANNLWFNWYFCGYSYMEINTQDMYQMYFPTHNEFTPISDKLDSVSCYLGQNAFFREKEIEDWYAAQDSFFLSGFWEYPAVDSFVTSDDNFTIGTNYKDFDPQFATPVGNTDEIVAWIDGYWYEERRPTDVPDWRVKLPVEFPDGGAPICNWPPEFDLSYANATLKAGGSDGLPIGDLNWFPEAKATYLTNRYQFIAALQDSIANAKKIYAPPAPTPFITPGMIAVDDENVTTPVEFSLAQNYPNPFNPSTTIEYTVAKSGIVKIELFNLLGQRVKTLVNDHKLSGKYTIKVDANDLVSGIYFYSIKAGDFNQTKKLIIMK